MERKWSRQWKASKQPRKQRLYSKMAPLHILGKMVSSHLSKELRKKHGKRNLRVRRGDKVMVIRGEHKGKSGRVERVDLKKRKVYITGIEITRRDGTKVLLPFNPSKLIIQELAEEKRRF